MKGKFILITFLISFNSLGQSYKDVMSIKDIDSFKKVCIENSYELFTKEKLRQEMERAEETMPEDSINMLFENNIWYKKGDDMMLYQTSDEGQLVKDAFSLRIERKLFWFETEIKDNPYDKLLEDVKKNCKYVKIITTETGNDYASYSCAESLYKGKIGFRVDGREGIVWTFPNE